MNCLVIEGLSNLSTDMNLRKQKIFLSSKFKNLPQIILSVIVVIVQFSEFIT